MIAGTIYQASKMMELTREWEKKKDSGTLGKKKVETMTAKERELHTYQEQLEKQREGKKYSAIYAKMQSGQELSPAEEQALKQRDPKTYMEYKAKQAERKAYEERLRNCKTKEEAQQLQTNRVQTNLSRLKSVINNPHIPKEEKLKQAQLIQGDTVASAEIFHDFAASEEYKKLPTQEEIVQENRTEQEVVEAQVSELVESLEEPENFVGEEVSDALPEMSLEEKSASKEVFQNASEEKFYAEEKEMLDEVEQLCIKELRKQTKGIVIDEII